MARFLLVFMGGGVDSLKYTNEDQKRLNKAWEDWRANLGQSLVDPGFATDAVISAYETGKRDWLGDRIAYFCVIDVDSFDSAIATAQRSPTITEAKGYVDIYNSLDVNSLNPEAGERENPYVRTITPEEMEAQSQNANISNLSADVGTGTSANTSQPDVYQQQTTPVTGVTEPNDSSGISGELDVHGGSESGDQNPIDPNRQA